MPNGVDSKEDGRDYTYGGDYLKDRIHICIEYYLESVMATSRIWPSLGSTAELSDHQCNAVPRKPKFQWLALDRNQRC